MVGGGRETHLTDSTLKFAVRKRVHGELHPLLFQHIADVCFGNGQLDLHLGQILSNQKQGGGTEARGYGLTGIHIPGHHHATDRSKDGRTIEIYLSALNGGLACLDPSLGLQQ